MPIEAAAIEHLTEKTNMSHDVAVAIAKSIDVSISGANLVTLRVFNERFAQLERSIAAMKVWAVGLYAALTITFFGALAAENYFLVSREDRLIEGVEGQMERRFERIDRRFDTIDAHLQDHDREFAPVEGRMDRIEGRMGALEKRVQRSAQ